MEAINLRIEILNKAHCSGLAALFQQVFNKRVSANYFESKYGLTRVERKQYALVGIVNDEVIGFFGAIPLPYTLNQETYELVFTCDYFLQETYRGKGVFDQLYTALLNNLEREPAHYLFAYHSDQTYKFCGKHNWDDAADFVRFELIAFPKPVKSSLERLMGAVWSRNQLRKRLEKFRVDGSILQFMEPENGRLQYSSEFLEMKQFEERYFVEIDGCVLWLKYDYRMTIGWLHVKPNGDVSKMLRKLKRIARNSGIHQVVFHTAPHSDAYEILKAELTEAPSFKVSSLPLQENLPPFEQFKFHFIDGDLF